MSINDTCDYIIMMLTEGSESLSNIKLQKLLYYVQAWNLAFYGKPFYSENENFEAWVHGPVSREIYNRFREHKSLYSDIKYEDITETFNPDLLDENEKKHIEVILETYAKFSGSELENMTHMEYPWINAREGYRSSERCEKQINNQDMIDYYSSRLS